MILTSEKRKALKAEAMQSSNLNSPKSEEDKQVENLFGILSALITKQIEHEFFLACLTPKDSIVTSVVLHSSKYAPSYIHDNDGKTISIPSLLSEEYPWPTNPIWVKVVSSIKEFISDDGGSLSLDVSYDCLGGIAVTIKVIIPL